MKNLFLTIWNPKPKQTTQPPEGIDLFQIAQTYCRQHKTEIQNRYSYNGYLRNPKQIIVIQPLLMLPKEE